MLINWTHHEDNDADGGDTDRYADRGDMSLFSRHIKANN